MIGRRMKLGYLMLFAVLTSCSPGIEKKDLANYNLIFSYNPWVKIDFKTKLVSVKLDTLRYTDTVHLTQEEQNTIMNSFIDNNISEIKGDTLFVESVSIMPPSEFKINVLLNGKPKSAIAIDSECKNKGFFPFTTRYEVLSFQNDVLTVLNNKSEVTKAKAVLLKYMQDHHLFVL